jgi:hypothetical protein
VSGGLTLWRLLTESWPLVWPIARVSEEIGADAVRQALRLRLVRRASLIGGMTYPCRRLCPMTLVQERDSLVALCGRASNRCAAEPIPAADAFQIEADASTVVGALQAILRLPPIAPGPDRAALGLGTRRVGRHAVTFVLSPRPQLVTDWIARAVREDPDRVLVMITFSAGQIPAHAPRRIDGTRVVWVALEEALNSADCLDLSDVWLGLGSAAVVASELWPRYAFVVDEARDFCAYAGVRVPLERNGREALLLHILLRRAGHHMTRQELHPALWPDDFGGRRRPPSPDLLDNRLRQVKLALSSIFKGMRLPVGAVQDPIETLRTRTDTDGGYRVAVDPDRVLFVE